MTTPDDYDAGDGWDETTASECCPHCETVWSPNGGMIGPAFDASGTKHESYFDTDPGDGPFFCEDCWKELDANRKRDQHRTLGEF